MVLETLCLWGGQTDIVCQECMWAPSSGLSLDGRPTLSHLNTVRKSLVLAHRAASGGLSPTSLHPLAASAPLTPVSPVAPLLMESCSADDSSSGHPQLRLRCGPGFSFWCESAMRWTASEAIK